MPKLVRVNLEQREELFKSPLNSPFTKGGRGIYPAAS